MRIVPIVLAAALLTAPAAQAGFAGTDLVLPAVARITGAGNPPAQFYSTVWLTNLSPASTAEVELRFLKQGQVNPSPHAVPLTLAAGETRRIDNAVEALFGLTSAAGAIRITSTRSLLVSSRTFDKPAGSDIGDAKGTFFGAVPASFAIGAGETAYLQGVSQNGGEDYRTNFGLVETTGRAAKVRVTLRSASGSSLATADYDLGVHEARQWGVASLFSGVATANARIEATVVSGAGAVLLYGTQIANGSQDSSGFEMSFKDGLLAGNEASSAETVSATVATMTESVAQATWDLAPRLGTTGSIAPTATVPFTASYDSATGWWTVSAFLNGTTDAELQVRFEDAQGTAQRLYRPQETERIRVKGSAAGVQGAVVFDLVLTGVKQGSPSIIVNGTCSGTIQGASGDATVANVVIPKTAGAYPSSGTITILSNGITVTLTFNGTKTVAGTYTFRNHTSTFTIDLETGEVTKG